MTNIKGVDELAVASKLLSADSGIYYQVNYDTNKKEVHTSWIFDEWKMSRVKSPDPNVIYCGIVDRPMSEEEITKIVENGLIRWSKQKQRMLMS
ncbi:hypothetical protein SAMN05216249_10475 [Acetitomaculum ruminis DSM 5522]|uniref:Uncharacterized protein n=1 Tax=Acetitomaculum ruminis DSM 5522 TaxID=1120918 RepID=A0A1I0WGR3_9FIRM|nr:hypothetical protein [Acetitomaculum ruminis]SFA87975.1 hypothetical protein SAMN05216249_10475 [Acetitomaculum ruminis DSM 5522]